eukprot:CAMPEP_0185499916 /NCGR_PEP_ID=MMETSP1366-20130426/23230_1 /TAXON_ID=38817 /ORGANISM="Gephyrocapsa oceanica, Strain RCC1303" /LENGTH=48 /DNA_ID= /DNA_START= /DNA_END= /DNA_ORIENTATION=
MTTREVPNPRNVYSEGAAADRCLAVARRQQQPPRSASRWQKARRRGAR